MPASPDPNLSRPTDAPTLKSALRSVVPDVELFNPRHYGRGEMPSALERFAAHFKSRGEGAPVIAAGLAASAEQLRRLVQGTFREHPSDCEADLREAAALIAECVGGAAGEAGLALDSHIVLPTRVAVIPDARTANVASEIGFLSREIPTITGIDIGVAGSTASSLLRELRIVSAGGLLNQYIQLQPGSYKRLTLNEARLLTDELYEFISPQTHALGITNVELPRDCLAKFVAAAGTASVSTLSFLGARRPTDVLEALAFSPEALQAVQDLAVTAAEDSRIDETLFSIEKLPAVERLCLDSRSMLPAKAAQLIGAASTPSLHSMVYDFRQQSGAEIALMCEAMRQRGSITSLTLSGCVGDGAPGRLFSAGIPLSPQMLEISDSRLSGPDISAIRCLSQLKRLGLSGGQLDAGALAALPGLAASLDLRELDLRGTAAQLSVVEAVLRQAPHLRVQVSSPRFRDEKHLNWGDVRLLEEQFGAGRVAVY